MDLQLYARVIWRFRVVAGAAAAIAILLAVFSYVKIGFSGGHPTVSHRQSEQWVSYSKIFVTQRGFAIGRLNAGEGVPIDADKSLPPSQRSRFADPLRFTTLAITYANAIDSDAIHRLIAQRGPIPGSVEAAPLYVNGTSGEALPFVKVAGISDSPAHSLDLTKRATGALKTWVHRNQVSSQIEPKDRVQLSTISAATQPILLAGRSRTLPVVVFLTVLLAGCGFCFLLENLRPRIRPIVAEDEDVETRAAA